MYLRIVDHEQLARKKLTVCRIYKDRALVGICSKPSVPILFVRFGTKFVNCIEIRNSKIYSLIEVLLGST